MSHYKNENIDEFLGYVKRLADESDRRFDDADETVCILVMKKMKSCIGAVELLKSAKLTENSEMSNLSTEKLLEISSLLSELLQHWESHLKEKSKDTKKPDFTRYQCNLKHSSMKGRPSYDIDFQQVQYLKELSFTWKAISAIIGVHRTTLWRKLKKDFPEMLNSVYSDISDNELDTEVKSLKDTHPLAGERMLLGMLRARSVNVQRQRIRNSIHRVDPINTAVRWIRKNPRWKYSVPGPNSLWHNDGLHKAIHWKIIIHACIDGYSRLIVYLICAANNLAATVLDAFKTAEKKFGLPERIRGDHGSENNDLARYVREKQERHNAYIQGPSVHNQRIERLHYDTTHCVLSHYIDLFLFMEENDMLDRNDDIHILCLHRVFLSRIQASLTEFQEGWNQHPVSTEINKTPYQIWTEGMMNRNFENQKAVESYLRNDSGETDLFGVDLSLDSTSFLDDDNDNIIEIEEINIGEKREKIEEFFRATDTSQNDNNFGINHFIFLKETVTRILN